MKQQTCDWASKKGPSWHKIYHIKTFVNILCSVYNTYLYTFYKLPIKMFIDDTNLSLMALAEH